MDPRSGVVMMIPHPVALGFLASVWFGLIALPLPPVSAATAEVDRTKIIQPTTAPELLSGSADPLRPPRKR